jgi:hypothetical protein
MRAAVNLSGCSAAFISADGLIATNHHCAYAAIQGNSSVEHDYLRDGFVARERGQELPGKGLSVRVIDRGVDGPSAGAGDFDARLTGCGKSFYASG